MTGIVRRNPDYIPGYLPQDQGGLSSAVFKSRAYVRRFWKSGDPDWTAAFQRASASGAKTIIVDGDIAYSVSDATQILSNQTWDFCGPTIQLTDETKRIFEAIGQSGFSLLGKLILRGNLSVADTKPETGLYVDGCSRFRVEGVETRNFKGKGIHKGALQANPGALRGDRGQWSDIAAFECTVGVQADAGSGAEYDTFSNANVSGCIDGLNVGAGNLTWNGGSVVDNTRGVSLIAGPNHCHGSFNGVNINHNTQYNVVADGVLYGHSFNDCHIYGNGGGSGAIWLKGSKGIHFLGGHLDCWIYNDTGAGSGMNVIRGMYFPEGYGVTKNTTNAGLHQLACADNFTNAGPWSGNDPAPVFAQAARGGTDQAIGGGVVPLIFNSEIEDNRQAFNPATGEFTAPVDGFYRVTWAVFFTGTGVTSGYVQVQKNAVGVADNSLNLTPMSETGAAVVKCLAGDKLRLAAIVTATTCALKKDYSTMTVEICG